MLAAEIQEKVHWRRLSVKYSCVLCILHVALCIFGDWCFRKVSSACFLWLYFKMHSMRLYIHVFILHFQSFWTSIQISVLLFYGSNNPVSFQHCIIKWHGIALWIDTISVPLLHSGLDPKLFDYETLTWMWVHLRDMNNSRVNLNVFRKVFSTQTT